MAKRPIFSWLMQKAISFLIVFLTTLMAGSQELDGTWYALELNGLATDTSGKVDFYMRDSFPKEKWFHQVEVTIKGSAIMLEKHPVHIDSTGEKSYSASDGGILTYKGKISKWDNVYIARTQLADFDYIGFSLFEPPLIADDVDTTVIQKPISNRPKGTVKELRQTHDVTKGPNGIEVFLPKGTLRKDFVLRPAKEGLWVNNVLYHRKAGRVVKP